MRTRLLSTCQIDNIRFVSLLRRDMFVAASPDKLLWCRVRNSTVEEVRRSSHGGRSFSLFPLHDHAQAAFQLEHGPGCYSLRLLDEDGFKGQPVPVPFSWTNQVTADSSGSLLAAFGSLVLLDRPGWIAPVESCLVDMESGDVQRLPYSAVVLQEDVLYFVHDHILYKTRLSPSRRLTLMRYPSALAEGTDMIASDIPSGVITLAPKNGHVRVVTTDGLYAVSSSGVTPVHKWEVRSRALVCGDICFASDVGPEVQVYDAKKQAATCVTSSPKTQVTGFDALGPSRGAAADDGLLMIVSEKGVLDRFSWSSSGEK